MHLQHLNEPIDAVVTLSSSHPPRAPDTSDGSTAPKKRKVNSNYACVHCTHFISLSICTNQCTQFMQVDKLKAYPSSLQKALDESECLRANRRGIVEVNSDSEKPTMTPSELIQFRRLGLSYKQIGKKLGIDPHREDVLQVYEAIKDATHLDIQRDVEGPAKVSPTNPLWYTFRSERDIIAKSIIPPREHVLSLGPQHRVKERLGDHAGFMLGMYRQVQSIIHEEILSSFDGAPHKSPIGQMQQWVGDMPSSVCKSVFDIEAAVGEEAFELTQYWEDPQGRCKCSAVKVIRFGWKTSPIPHPSFFWGCSKYTPIDSYAHDKGVPTNKSCWAILDPDSHNRGKSSHISDTELDRLASRLALVDDFWSTREEEEDDLQQLLTAASKHYGGRSEDLPLADVASVQTVINLIRDEVKYLKDERATAAMSAND